MYKNNFKQRLSFWGKVHKKETMENNRNTKFQNCIAKRCYIWDELAIIPKQFSFATHWCFAHAAVPLSHARTNLLNVFWFQGGSLSRRIYIPIQHGFILNLCGYSSCVLRFVGWCIQFKKSDMNKSFIPPGKAKKWILCSNTDANEVPLWQGCNMVGATITHEECVWPNPKTNNFRNVGLAFPFVTFNTLIFPQLILN